MYELPEDDTSHDAMAVALSLDWSMVGLMNGRICGIIPVRPPMPCFKSRRYKLHAVADRLSIHSQFF